MEETVVRKGHRWEDIKMDLGEMRKLMMCAVQGSAMGFYKYGASSSRQNKVGTLLTGLVTISFSRKILSKSVHRKAEPAPTAELPACI